MKSASEPAIEYWNKPPQERINKTVQDYIFDHQQAKIDHIREYLTSGMEVATENSEYWLALRDCLNELNGIVK